MAKQNKVKYNLKNVHYAVQTRSESGALTFSSPKPIPGAVNLQMDAQGESNTFYADGVAYYVSYANSGYSGNLEVALIPESFSVDVLKERLHDTDKVLVENSTVEPALFALLFQFDGDAHSVRHVMYNCSVGRPSVTGATTTKTREPQTSTMPITASPLADGTVKARTTADTPNATYEAWFESVWQPTNPAPVDPNSLQPLADLGAA